jgi:aminoglycoside 6'-N-acetyltransferase
MELKGDRVVLRPLAAADVPRLSELSRQPGFSRWWPGLEEAELLALASGSADAVAFAVVHDGDVIGLAQFYEEDDEEYRHAGIDLGLGDAWQGQGLGTDAVRTLARHLVHERGHHRLVIDPAADNARAIRCYEKVGFRRVGILREYERGADGTWHDGLLMDLLARELT